MRNTDLIVKVKLDTASVEQLVETITKLRDEGLLAVRLPPPVPPTIGHPQSVRDNPPPKDEWVLEWSGDHYIARRGGLTLPQGEWWVPMPAPQPGVTP